VHLVNPFFVLAFYDVLQLAANTASPAFSVIVCRRRCYGSFDCPPPHLPPLSTTTIVDVSPSSSCCCRCRDHDRHCHRSNSIGVAHRPPSPSRGHCRRQDLPLVNVAIFPPLAFCFLGGGGRCFVATAPLPVEVSSSRPKTIARIKSGRNPQILKIPSSGKKKVMWKTSSVSSPTRKQNSVSLSTPLVHPLHSFRPQRSPTTSRHASTGFLAGKKLAPTNLKRSSVHTKKLDN
jgi:hypothetical protein